MLVAWAWFLCRRHGERPPWRWRTKTKRVGVGRGARLRRVWPGPSNRDPDHDRDNGDREPSEQPPNLERTLRRRRAWPLRRRRFSSSASGGRLLCFFPVIALAHAVEDLSIPSPPDPRAHRQRCGGPRALPARAEDCPQRACQKGGRLGRLTSGRLPNLAVNPATMSRRRGWADSWGAAERRCVLPVAARPRPKARRPNIVLTASLGEPCGREQVPRPVDSGGKRERAQPAAGIGGSGQGRGIGRTMGGDVGICIMGDRSGGSAQERGAGGAGAAAR